MKKSYLVLMLIVVMFFSPLVVSAGAAEIAAKNITETEDAGISNVDSTSMLEVQCGRQGTAAYALGQGLLWGAIVFVAASVILSG